MCRLALIVLVASLVVLVGCGGDDAPAPQALTPAEHLAVGDLEILVAEIRYSKEPTNDGPKAVLDRVIALARAKPDAVYETDTRGASGSGGSLTRRTMRQVLADAASSTEAALPELAERLDRVIETLPPSEP